MDLVPMGADSPLPPAPISRASSVPSTHAELVRQLAGLAAVLGHPAPTKVLSGNIPAIDIEPEKLIDASLYLRDVLGFNLLSCVSGVDMQTHLEVVYHLRNLSNDWLLQMKVRVPQTENAVDTVMSIWPTANWLERETFDLYGMRFIGHPDLRRILLDDEFEGYPLLKSFRPSPLTHHDPATTQVGGELAVSAEPQRDIGHQRAIPSHLSQGDQERLHPGTPTFGSTQFHGRDFPPQTWKHLQGTHDDSAKPDEKK